MTGRFSLQKKGGSKTTKKSAKDKNPLNGISRKRKPTYLEEVEFAPCGVEIKKGSKDNHLEVCPSKVCKKARSESFEKAV